MLKMVPRIILSSLLSTLLILQLTACNRDGLVTKEGVGQVTGGVLGGILGSQISGRGSTAATIGGVLLGGYLGGALGRQMDDRDRARLAYSLEHSPTHHASRWRDPDKNKEFVVVPVSTYRDSNQRVCRRFRTTVIIDGRRQQALGRACRQSNGSWRIVS